MITKLNKYYIKQAGYNPDAPELCQIINASTENIKIAIEKHLDLLADYVQELIINDFVKIYYQNIN